MILNETDFRRMVEQYHGTITSICLMYANCQDDVNDLTQEALIRIWQGLSSFKGDSDLRTWIWRVTVNSCLNQVIKRAKAPKCDAQLPDIISGQDEDSSQMQELHRRIRQLSPFDRAIIMLWLDDMSYEEIASIMGITVKNVSVRLVRIRQQLKSM